MWLLLVFLPLDTRGSPMLNPFAGFESRVVMMIDGTSKISELKGRALVGSARTSLVTRFVKAHRRRFAEQLRGFSGEDWLCTVVV